MALPALLIAGAVGLAAVGGTAAVAAATAGETVVVQRVVDGDTFDAVSENGGEIRVRLLNVDTPETKSGPVECLGPEASARLAALLPTGSTVTLDRDGETVDGYGRELAGVTNADGVFVNEQLARDGLGVPMVVGGNDRFFAEVDAANKEARAAQRGLYAEDVACTLPAQVQQVEASGTAATSAPAWTPEQYDALAGRSDAVVTQARALLGWFDGPRPGVVWSAFSRVEQDQHRSRVQAVLDDAVLVGSTSRTTAAGLRERAAAQQRAQEEAARQEAARQEAARREAARQEAAREEAAAQERADERERRRAAASSDDSSSSGSPRASGGSSSSGSASAYPGYTGPRCYAPGGRTWRPC